MKQRLRIVCPFLQLLAIALALAWERLSHAEATVSLYVLPTRHALLNLNFPLLIIWWPILRFVSWLGGYLQSPGHFNETAFAIVGVVVALAIISSVVLFWYGVVVEAQMRIMGKSAIRFSQAGVECVRILTFLLCGFGSFFRLYSETLSPVRHGFAFQGLWPVEIVLSALFLTAWAGAFILTSIIDGKKLMLLSKEERLTVEH